MWGCENAFLVVDCYIDRINFGTAQWLPEDSHDKTPESMSQADKKPST